MTFVELYVIIDCPGCERKVRKALAHLRGIDDIDIDRARQKVTVTGSMDQKKVLTAVRKTGCRAILWPYQMNSAEHGYDIMQERHSYHSQHTPMPIQHMILSAGARSYNYYKHGYDDSNLHGHLALPEGTMDKARSFFSDENPNACSVM